MCSYTCFNHEIANNQLSGVSRRHSCAIGLDPVCGRSGKHPLLVYRSELCVLVTQKLLHYVPLAYENNKPKEKSIGGPSFDAI